MDAGIGDRVRMVRNAKGWSMQVLADFAGVTKSAICQWENGDRPLDQLRNIDALAEALGVSRAYLLGYSNPVTAESATAEAQVNRVRAALMDAELGTRPDVEQPRALGHLEDALRRVHDSIALGEITRAAKTIPDLLLELHTWVVDGDEAECDQSLRALVLTLASTITVAKWVNQPDLAWIAGVSAREAAARLNDPALIAHAANQASFAAVPYARSLTIASDGLDTLGSDIGRDHFTMSAGGMLHLRAAYTHAMLGHSDDVRAHLAEASDLARRNGERNDFNTWFGPTNVSIWSVAIAVEQGEGGRVPEMAKRVNLRVMPSHSRQAYFWTDLGRGLAQAGRDREAVEAFVRSEKLAPEFTHHNPLVRETTRNILMRESRSAGGPALRGLAHRVGAIPT